MITVLMGNEDYIAFYSINGDIPHHSSGSTNAWGKIYWDRANREPCIKLEDVSFFIFGGGTFNYNFSDFVDKIWALICKELEQSS